MKATLVRILPEDDQYRLFQVIPQRSPFGIRDRSLILFDLNTGLRAAELCGLNVEHVVWEGRIRHQLEIGKDVGCKGGRSRLVPLNTTARLAVAEILKFNKSRGFPVGPQDPLLMTRYHTRLPIRSLQDMMQKYREKAGMDVKATPHMLRHTMASKVASTTGNLRIVQKVLGHEWLRTVKIYTHPTPEEMADAMDQIG